MRQPSQPNQPSNSYRQNPVRFDNPYQVSILHYLRLAILICLCAIAIHPPFVHAMSHPLHLLSDPFLQFPTDRSVKVVWFTEFAGTEHTVIYGEQLDKIAIAKTTPLSRTREDRKSWIDAQKADGLLFSRPTERPVWRHEAKITGLIPHQRLPYWVKSVSEDGRSSQSEIFSLSASPPPGQALKILLTSDHQLKPMTAANLQKVAETFPLIDAIFHAGDFVNTPDRASEWFDDSRGCAFFPGLQGRANYELTSPELTTHYQGGKLIQFAPLFPTIGNHEVMGKFSRIEDLDVQMSHAVPRAVAQEHSDRNFDERTSNSSRDSWIENHSFNTKTYTEIFSLPDRQNYYAVTFGDIRLVVLYITNIWRNPGLTPEVRGRYQEKEADFKHPENWGYGQFIFESIERGSPQYQWLESELKSSEFQQTKYKIVMFHHPPHTLGGNIVPPYTNPIQQIDRDSSGTITAIRYEYPPDQDYIIRDVIPLLKSAGVQLVFYGHSHLWNRFKDDKIHFLESSNVGNSYGVHLEGNPRPIPPNSNYIAVGDPNGLEPIVPTLSPLLDPQGKPFPYIASNELTVFSILDTETGTVSSYRFDTQNPDSEVIKFDEFSLIQD